MDLNRFPFLLTCVVCATLNVMPVHSKDGEVPALTVAVVNPVERHWPVMAPASGWLRPWHEAIAASEIGGLQITEILVDVGSVVKRGAPLARLSNESLRAELRSGQAAVEVAKAELAKAGAKAARARRLQPSGAISDAQIAEDLSEEQVARALLQSSEAALEVHNIKLDQTTLFAIDDGFISSRTAQLGAVVSSGAELFRLVRQGRVEWQAEVSARYLSSIKPGLSVAVFGPANDVLRGKVRLVRPTLNAETARAIVYVELDSSANPPVNFFSSGHIELNTTPALTVPETALSFRDGMSYVFTVNEQHRVSRVRVQTGRRDSGEIEVLSGLERSASVVQAGGSFLSDGSLVKIQGK